MGDAIELSELQLAMMSVLWKQREATAADVHVALAARDLAITTVATVLQRLEKRGVITHRAEGRTFIYRAAVPEREVRRSMLRSLTVSLFSGDPAAVVSHLLTARDVSPGDLDRMQRLIDERRKATKQRHD